MAMIHYTGWQWLLIDAATQYGLDKLTFEERMAWTQEHLDDLEMMLLRDGIDPLHVEHSS
jgi:DNA-directed RNA polymerase